MEALLVGESRLSQSIRIGRWSCDQVIWRVPNAECQGVARDQCLTREVDFLGVQVKLDLYPQSCQAHSRPVLRLQNPDYANVWLTFKVVWNGKQLLNNNYIERDRYWEHPSNIQAEDFEIDIYCHDANSRHVLRYLAEKQRREESEAKAERLASEVSRFHALMKAGSDQAAERACRLTRSAVKIQAKWRQVSTRRWFLQERSEKVWRTQQIKFQAETPYDAILVSLLVMHAFCFQVLVNFKCVKALKELVRVLQYLQYM